MAALLAVLAPLQWANDKLLTLGRWLAVAALSLMVLAILIQIFFRYALNAALPWPEEAARFMMLWMTGLIAPLAYRQGGFVAIDMAERALPPLLSRLLTLFLLAVSLFVLVYAVQIGWSEVTGFGGRFATASLYVPTAFDLSEWLRVPRSWMMASLLLGLALMILVNVELLLRTVVAMLGGEDRLRPVADAAEPLAE